MDDRTRQYLESVGNADIVVGIPSYRNAGTIGFVARAASEGLHRYFPNLRGIVINSDGGSIDGTREVFDRVTFAPGVESVSFMYQGIPGKGTAVRAILEAASLLGAKAVILVDADLRSITSEWIRILAEPVIDGVDFVTPYYSRHKYDGTITNSICYPLIRSLYGKRIRQPIGGDFGLSGRFADGVLRKDVWGTDAARFGIDILLTTTAINDGFRVVQARLGAKVHDAKDPASDLGPMFSQVVGTLFDLMATYQLNWLKTNGSIDVQILGPPVDLEPDPIPVNLPGLTSRFRQGLSEHSQILGEVLEAEAFVRVKELAGQNDESFQFPAELWARAVYDIAVAYHRPDVSRDELIRALIPLYFGRVAGYAGETLHLDAVESEQVVERQAESFEELKPYLIEKWTEVMGNRPATCPDRVKRR